MKTTLIMLPQPILVKGQINIDHLPNLPKGSTVIAGIEGLPKLDLSAIAKRIGWVDVEKLAIENIKKGWGQLFMRNDKGNHYGKFIGERPYPTKFWHDIDKWVEGFKLSQSLNEKKYSEEEARMIWKAGQEYWKTSGDSITFEELIEKRQQLLSKPKEYQVSAFFDEKTNSYKLTKIV